MLHQYSPSLAAESVKHATDAPVAGPSIAHES